jgi:putative ferrous iron transport protein C
MLRDVQTYMAQNGTVSLADLSRHFHIQQDALQPMLSKLSRKGRIRQLPTAAKCCGCTACDRDTLDLYEWLGR